MNDALRLTIHIIIAANLLLFLLYAIIAALIVNWLRAGKNGDYKGLLHLAIANIFNRVWIVVAAAIFLYLDFDVSGFTPFPPWLLAFIAISALYHIGALMVLAIMSFKEPTK